MQCISKTLVVSSFLLLVFACTNTSMAMDQERAAKSDLQKLAEFPDTLQSMETELERLIARKERGQLSDEDNKRLEALKAKGRTWRSQYAGLIQGAVAKIGADLAEITRVGAPRKEEKALRARPKISKKTEEDESSFFTADTLTYIKVGGVLFGLWVVINNRRELCRMLGKITLLPQ